MMAGYMQRFLLTCGVCRRSPIHSRPGLIALLMCYRTSSHHSLYLSSFHIAVLNLVRPRIWVYIVRKQEAFRIWYLSIDVVVNSESYPGAIGFQTRLLPWIYPVTLIRVNEETGEPIRNHRGLCMRCEPGQLSVMSFVYEDDV